MEKMQAQLQTQPWNVYSNADEDWAKARAWLDHANLDRDDWAQPVWSFDCSYKLDFDGPLVHISSRFYGPNKGGDAWDGKLHLMVGDKSLMERSFKAATIDELQDEVTQYSEDLQQAVAHLLTERISQLTEHATQNTGEQE